jgi:hypothetical protein
MDPLAANPPCEAPCPATQSPYDERLPHHRKEIGTMNMSYRNIERRHARQIALVERRKGRTWMYGELALFGALMLYLMSLLK